MEKMSSSPLPVTSVSLQTTWAGFLCGPQDTVHEGSRETFYWSHFHFSCCHFLTVAPLPNTRTCVWLCPVRQHSTTWMQCHLSYCNQMESVCRKPKQALPRNKSGKRFITCSRYNFQSSVPPRTNKTWGFCSGNLCSQREGTLGAGTLVHMLNFR